MNASHILLQGAEEEERLKRKNPRFRFARTISKNQMKISLRRTKNAEPLKAICQECIPNSKKA